jgi:hypothetical protein
MEEQREDIPDRTIGRNGPWQQFHCHGIDELLARSEFLWNLMRFPAFEIEAADDDRELLTKVDGLFDR